MSPRFVCFRIGRSKSPTGFYSDSLDGAKSLAETIAIPESMLEPPAAAKTLWTSAGVVRFAKGERGSPRSVFERLVAVVDHFMDFDHSLGPQKTVCELVALYVMSTYMLDGFQVIGYLRSSGDTGSGKTTLLEIIAETAHLGSLVTSGGSFASLRDLSDMGATICFDDAERIMDPRKGDPDKQALLLAGNRRGVSIPMKELAPDGKRWKTRLVNTFCPRCFSAISLPDRVLGSRSIQIPLVRSLKPKGKDDPGDLTKWPSPRGRLVDDLWSVGLSALNGISGFDDRAAATARLTGRSLQPWRSIFAVALWLQEAHGCAELFTRLEQLSVDYQKEREQLEATDRIRVMLMALDAIVGESLVDPITFNARDLCARMNTVARELGLVGDGEDEKPFANSKAVGKMLEKLRFDRADVKKKRGQTLPWCVSRDRFADLAESYSIEPEDPVDAGDPEEEYSEDGWVQAP